MWTGFIWLGSTEHSNKPLGFIKGGEFTDQLVKKRITKNESCVWQVNFLLTFIFYMLLYYRLISQTEEAAIPSAAALGRKDITLLQTCTPAVLTFVCGTWLHQPLFLN